LSLGIVENFIELEMPSMWSGGRALGEFERRSSDEAPARAATDRDGRRRHARVPLD
jgi:hypothetical protein